MNSNSRKRNLKKGGSYLQQKRLEKYKFIEKQKDNHSIGRLCRALKVSEDAFYAWRGAKTYRLSPHKSELAARVKEVFYLHRRRYGARRISAERESEKAFTFLFQKRETVCADWR